ncbi:MAG: SDR family NAD(P)-dependent oxidoreductase, partial [Abditibacteriales bacterium]|nr:SDR family NAD(P)-dependent oxidoreductase [Abditibacteriales bacterium]
MSSERVLVTGGAGFIGSHIVEGLVARGYRVTVFDSLDPQVHPDSQLPKYLSKDVEFVLGDVRDYLAFKEVVVKAEVVFHQAAAVGVGQSQYQIRHYVEVNTLGTANLLDIIANHKTNVRKIIIAASMSSYGEGCYRCEACGPVRPPLRSEEQMARGDWELHCPQCDVTLTPTPTDENAAQVCTSIYAFTKRHQEEMALLIGKTYNIPVVALRYFNVYGPRQSLSNPYTGVAAIFLSRLKNDRPPVIYEDGLQTRDFVSVHDVVQANLLALEKEEANFEVFNVGTGRAVTIRHVAETLAQRLGKDIPPEITHRFRKGDVRHCFASIEKIRQRLGYEPKVSFEEGMAELVAWSQEVAAVDRFAEAAQELT